MALWPSVTTLPGAQTALSLLHGHVELCIATNAQVSTQNEIMTALVRAGLGHYFSRIFCYTDLGLRKNEAGFWHKVSQTLGCPTHEIAMIGDSLEHDAQGPARFGVQSVWLSSQLAPTVASTSSLEDFAHAVLKTLTS
ncbi:HAD family hydrolase [Chitinibacteraceae bacterium HSL-7]